MTKRDPDKEGSVSPKGDSEQQEKWVSPISTSYVPGYGAGYGVSNERTLKDYPMILLRHWPVVIAMILIGVFTAMYQTSRTPRMYRSSALVDFGAYIPPLEGPVSARLREETKSRSYRNTQIRLLKSLTLAERVLIDNRDVLRFLDPQAKPTEPKDGGSPTLPVHLLQRYLGLVSFQPIPQTDLVTIYSTSTSPLMAARVANAHAKSFISLVKERRRAGAVRNLDFLQEKYDDVTQQVEVAERDRLKHAETYALGGSSSEIVERTFGEKYNALVESLNNAISNRSIAQATYRELRKTKGLRGLEGNEETRGLIIGLRQQERNYQLLRNRLGGSSNPILKDMRYNIDSARMNLEQIGRERVQEARSQYQVAGQRERFLRDEFDKLHEEQIRISKHRVEQDTLQNKVASLKEVQSSLGKRLEDAMVNVQSNQESVTLVDKAFAPTGHISPNEASNLWTGCLLGGMLGLILAFLLDYVDNRVRSVTDLQASTRTQVLGVVPQFSRDAVRLSKASRRENDKTERRPVTQILESEEVFDSQAINSNAMSAQAAGAQVARVILGDDSPILSVSKPFSPEAEAFRGILATLMGPVEHRNRTLLVTSGQQGDGKTTLSVNLAASLAQMGEKTLLIDADLRLPNVQSYFGLPRGSLGLTDYLTGQADPSELIIQGGLEDLSLMLSGGTSPNPAALLRSEKMLTFLSDMQEQYDFIIIDSPPIGPVADSLLLAQHVDGVAVVVRSGETSKNVASSAVSRLQQVGANVMGLILNDTISGASYWAKGYNRYRTANSRYYTYHKS